ncbi:MAG: type II secretion system protein [Pseudomonadota bacterium]
MPRGFTLVELLVATAIGGLLMVVAVPASMRMYQSMQYRGAVQDVVSGLASARHRSLVSGVAQDLEINPRENSLTLGDKRWQLPDGMRLAVRSAGEINRDNLGVIRFYPEGGASGGGIDVESPTGRGVKINVDWLTGHLSQVTYEAN